MSGFCPSLGSIERSLSPVLISHNNDEDLIYNDEYKPIYSRIQFLGQGTYGIVYLAENISTSQLCVIKQMKKFPDDEKGMQPTQLREASLLKNLKHKHIVEIKDIFFTNNKEFCLVFEHCQMDLYQYINDNKHNGIKLQLIKKWSYQMLSGISHMHSRRILHRDLKPQNIFLTHDMNIKIGDFGLSREHEIPIKNLSTNIITLWYRSPELLLGAECYAGKIDIWSAGCIISEMARNGKIMFSGLCEWEVLMKIFSFFGTPKNDNWCKNLPYFTAVFPKFKGVPFEREIGLLGNEKFACDLLKKMLNMDSVKRMNAIRLLKHPWFDMMESKECNDVNNDFFKNISISDNKQWDEYFEEVNVSQTPNDNHRTVSDEFGDYAMNNGSLIRCDKTIKKERKIRLKDNKDTDDVMFKINNHNKNIMSYRKRHRPKDYDKNRNISSSPTF